MSKADNVVHAFSAEHATKIAGMTERTLIYWDRTGFFKPQYATIGEGRSLVRVYSFRDLVSLRTLRVLRERHKVSLQHLRVVLDKLSTYSDAPFAELKLKVHKREVHFDEPDTGRTRAVVSGQYELLPIIDVIEDVRRAAASLTKRTSDDFGKVERHRNISHNVTVVAGTRIPVRAIERFVVSGFSTPEILKEYPSITEADIEAVRSEIGSQRAA